MNFLDIFNDDAFGLVSMTAAINKVDNIPGRAGALAFAGVGEGIATTTAVFEQKAETLSLIQSTPRGAPAPQETQDKATLNSVNIPQIKDEATIGAHMVQGVREFGSTNALRSAQAVVNTQTLKITRKMDLTLENLRLGALKGHVRDADGTLLADLYSLFGVSQGDDVNFDLTNTSADVRGKCQEVARYIKRNVKMTLPASAKIWAFCGDDFFDRFISHTNVKATYQNWQASEQRLGANYAFDVFSFGGINFENYAGTDDATIDDEGTIGIKPGECRFFLTGVPGLYAEYFAPADFWSTVNTIGLPRYSRVVPDRDMDRYVKVHVQMNPLPVCLRPATLLRGIKTEGYGSDNPQSAD